MPGLRTSLATLRALREKRDRLMPSTLGTLPSTAASASEGDLRLRQPADFGSNPGKLRMLAYAPAHLKPAAPLVVALHGCGQSAAEYAHGSGWTRLAERHGFVVVLPEQSQANNPKACFSWFLPGDIGRDQGEAHSIQQMVEHAIAAFGADRRRVYVTGLSAGGAMASVMLATYPEVYAGGAIIAGLPYGCAGNVQEALDAMFNERSFDGRDLGDRVRAASGHRGPWPRISVWHGSADAIVKPSNAGNIAAQWVDVHGLSHASSQSVPVGRHTRCSWHDAGGSALIEMYSIAGMAHGVPLDCSAQSADCGAPGAFFHDVGLSSTHLIARGWGLFDEAVETSCAEAPQMAEPDRLHAAETAVRVASASGVGWHQVAAANPIVDASKEAVATTLDPNRAIASAFEAAGLPAPELPSAVPGTQFLFDHAAIVEAALKAAGLKR